MDSTINITLPLINISENVSKYMPHSICVLTFSQVALSLALCVEVRLIGSGHRRLSPKSLFVILMICRNVVRNVGPEGECNRALEILQ